MLQAVKKAGVMHMICHNYRFAPAIQLAKKLIDGHIIGYEHTFINMMATFMEGLHSGINPAPNFEDGYRNQLVIEAVERSAESRQWMDVPAISDSLLFS